MSVFIEFGLLISVVADTVRSVAMAVNHCYDSV